MEKRSTSNNSRDENKQVRFDIKEGLMAFITEANIQIGDISAEKKVKKPMNIMQEMVVAPPEPSIITEQRA